VDVTVTRNSNSAVPQKALGLLKVASDFLHLRSSGMPEQMEAVGPGNLALDSRLLHGRIKHPFPQIVRVKVMTSAVEK
jgi:hypothetical protein